VFQVNYLSTVLLALLLLPKLAAYKDDMRNASPSRLTMVASDLALGTDMEDTDKREFWNGWISLEKNSAIFIITVTLS
jgi:hypothetical protein